MRKLKLLFLAAALTGSVGMMGQTDVTSTYITNAGFDESTDFQNSINTTGTAKDVTGWTHKQDGTGYHWAGCMNFVSGAKLNNTAIPSTNSDGGTTGGALCITGGWEDGNGYIAYEQELTLPAGNYTLTLPINNVGKNENFRVSLFTFKAGTNTYTGDVTSFPVNTWTTNTIRFSLTKEQKGTLSVGFGWKHTGSGNTPKLIIDYVKAMYTNYTTNLSNAIAYATQVNASISSDLTTAIATAQGVLDAADNTPAYQTTIDDAITTLCDAISAAVATDIENGDVTYLLTNPSFEKTDGGATSSAQALTSGGTYYGWELPSLGTNYVNISIGNSFTCNGQEFGIPNPTEGTYYYFARRGWNSSSSSDATLSTPILSELPAGRYTLTVDYKGVDKYNSSNSNQTSKGSKLTLNAAMSESILNSVDAAGFKELNNTTSTVMQGDDNWQTATLVFEVPTAGNVTLNIIHHFVGGVRSDAVIDNLRLEYLNVLAAAKVDLLEVINSATAITTAAINVGDGAFQIPTSAKTTLEAAITTAQGVYDSSTSTDEVETAITTLNTAITTFEASELNAPADGVQYRLKSTAAEAASWKNKYYTMSYNSEQTQGYHSISANQDAADYLAQAWLFTAVEGEGHTNEYTLSMTDEAGETRYVCTGKTGYGGTANYTQIRTTTDATKALVVEVIATTGTNGRWFLKNTEDNSYIGGQDAGFYSNSQNYDLAIEAASQASVNVTIASAVKYATRIFPFAPTLPNGVTAYSCEAKDDEVLTLSEVATPAANTPYILYAENGAASTDLTGWGTAATTSYTAGWLTGVYTATDAPVGTYVLQNNSGVVGFYLVETGKQPSVSANRCYLTVSADSKAAYFFDSEALGINAIDALTAGEAEIYNLNGVRLPALQKGMNIVKMKNGRTQKVMVK